MIKYILIILILSGCYNQRKAQQQVAKAGVYYPGVLAQKASELFPCTDVTGSDTVFIQADSSAYLNAISDLNNQLLSVYDVQDSLIAALQIDTACKKYEIIINDLKRRNINLQFQVANIKPIVNTIEIRDTIPDKAAIYACEFSRDQALQIATDKTAEAAKFKKRNRNKGWTLAGIAGLSLLLAGLLIRRKVKGK